MKRSLPLLCVILLTAIAAPPPPTDGTTTKLDPFLVREDPVNSFGFDLRVFWDRKTGKVTHIFFGKIQSEELARDLDLQAGDEIIKIAGRPVTEFDAHFKPDTELGKIFLARQPGAQLDLEIMRRRPGKITVTAGSANPLLRDR